MATIENNVLMRSKDTNGNINLFYPITKADNVDGLDESISSQIATQLTPIATSGTGDAYTATVDGVTALTVGVNFMMIPHVASTSMSPTLNVNSLGAVGIRRRLTSATGNTSPGGSDDWLTADKPVRATYDGTFWIVDLPKPEATDIMGTVSIVNGGTGVNSESDLKTLITSTAYQIGGNEPTSGPILWFDTAAV